MDSTMFLSQIWGPVLLAIGLGIFVSRDYYLKIYQDLEKETLAVLLFGMVAMSAGIAQILYHNVWGNLNEVIISLMGWGLLLKGAAFAIVPKLVDRGADWQASSKLIPLSGAVVLVLGAYLSWIAYFA